jgi:multisubunit Na+/H+ antiporter MnhG subunit
MFSAMMVVLLGLALGALGLLLPDMYVVGLIVILIGGIGVLVRLGDWYRSSGRSLF